MYSTGGSAWVSPSCDTAGKPEAGDILFSEWLSILFGSLAKGCVAARTKCWAYCLLPNHVHLILVPQAPEVLRESLAGVHRLYAQIINFRNGWREDL